MFLKSGKKMDKVYLVYCSRGTFDDYVRWVEFVCRDLFLAQERKLKIQKEIDTYKMLYFEQTKGRSYDEDIENYTRLSNEQQSFTIDFEEKYPKINITNIFIEERELI